MNVLRDKFAGAAVDLLAKALFNTLESTSRDKDNQKIERG